MKVQTLTPQDLFLRSLNLILFFSFVFGGSTPVPKLLQSMSSWFLSSSSTSKVARRRVREGITSCSAKYRPKQMFQPPPYEMNAPVWDGTVDFCLGGSGWNETF